jgi:hypothetical protein
MNPAARSRKADSNAMGAIGKQPSWAVIRQWFLLPLSDAKQKVDSGVPIVLPVGGKRALAEIVWPGDVSRQLRFVKAGRSNPYRLSREEYLELANTDNFWTHDELVHDLLAHWATRAAKRNPDLTKESDHFIQHMFAMQLVYFVLGRDSSKASEDEIFRERFAATREPHEIVHRYLATEHWKRTVELLDFESRLSRPRRKGTWANSERRRALYAAIRAAAERIKREHPGLGCSQSNLIVPIQSEPTVISKNAGKRPSRSTILRALAESPRLRLE